MLSPPAPRAAAKRPAMRLRRRTPQPLVVAQAGHLVDGLGPQDTTVVEVATGDLPARRRARDWLVEVPHQRTYPGPVATAPAVLPTPVGGRLSTFVREAAGFPSAARPDMGPARTCDGQVAAFFDVDNTLVRGTTLFRLAKTLCQEGFFRRDDLV
ncbi:MAG: hypothetical protein FWE61_01915, partial [Micrococcales bacterium]|nr:hypothetical protein [Micrococcales bacterium]